MKRSRISRIATLVSQAANVVLFDGNPDESISARAHREGALGGRPRWNRAARIINMVFWWEPDHCARAHAVDMAWASHLSAS